MGERRQLDMRPLSMRSPLFEVIDVVICNVRALVPRKVTLTPKSSLRRWTYFSKIGLIFPTMNCRCSSQDCRVTVAFAGQQLWKFSYSD